MAASANSLLDAYFVRAMRHSPCSMDSMVEVRWWRDRRERWRRRGPTFRPVDRRSYCCANVIVDVNVRETHSLLDGSVVVVVVVDVVVVVVVVMAGDLQGEVWVMVEGLCSELD